MYGSEAQLNFPVTENTRPSVSAAQYRAQSLSLDEPLTVGCRKVNSQPAPRDWDGILLTGEVAPSNTVER